MTRRSLVILLSLVAVCELGCATCCGPNMYTYPTFGGRVQRSDLEHGRVGSIFSDPMAEGGFANAVPTDPAAGGDRESQQPTPIEELEQRRPQTQPAPPNKNARRIRSGGGWR